MLLSSIVAAALLIMSACDDTPTDGDAQVDGDADGDVDADGDSDGDGDGNSDADSSSCDECEGECREGLCVVFLDEAPESGEVSAPGQMVVIRDILELSGNRLRVEAEAIIVEGTLDTTGAGFEGGGGGGGGGGGHRQATHGVSGEGGHGAETGDPGGAPAACGEDKYGAPGGNGGGGDGDHSGNGGGGGGCNQPDFHGAGRAGSQGDPGGYRGARSNGDTSTDDSVLPGSGGGGGGGGSGGGNGNGEGGGGGGGGGSGGAGGGTIELIAQRLLRIEGSIVTNGTFGADGAPGEPGVRTGENTGHGGDGGSGGDFGGDGDGDGGAGGGHEGGGTDGGEGGSGGPGAGGGVLLRCEGLDGLVISSTVESLGGLSFDNGGTVKVRSRGEAPSLTTIEAGRIHWLDLDTGESVDTGTTDPPDPTEDDILDPQRTEAFASGIVAVDGNRLMVGDVPYYPKTDFLTAVSPGDDIITYNTHTYLGQDATTRGRIRDALVDSNYNSIYLYTLNQGDYNAGSRAQNVVTPYGSSGWSFDTSALNTERVAAWHDELERLIEEDHLKPIIWLAADDSPAIAGASLDQFTTYLEHMVDAFEDLPIFWVLGLEVDEYWSAAQVSERREVLQSLSAHPVGVHLTTRETSRLPTEYITGFDIVLIQLSSPMSDAEYVEDATRALTVADVPIIAAEFNVSGTGAEATVTARSQAIGRLIAELGDPPLAAGIGNGIDLTSIEPPDPPVHVPEDFAGVTWLHTDVSGWAQTATLESVSIAGGQICLDYDLADVWPGVDHVDAFVNANPWIFIWQDDQWYAATWEWMRHGQTCKNVSAVAGDHIKRDPFLDFSPISGTWYGFMVSGLARDATRNVEERSNVIMFQWP